MSNPSLLPQGLGQIAADLGARKVRQNSGVEAAGTSVERAIANAARNTSVEFDYLVAQAEVESAMNPNAKAATSSAAGLFQFIEATWLDTMKRHGPRFGMDDIAAQISLSRNGGAYVSDPTQRNAILALRNDPQVASLMAAGLAEDNRSALTPILGRQPDHSELYLAHFLGAGGAGRFLSAMQSDPNQSAASLFRRPAAANRAVFYDNNGHARSLGGVMDYLGAKMDRALAGNGMSPEPNYAVAKAYTARAANPASDRAIAHMDTRPTLSLAAPASSSMLPQTVRRPMSSLMSEGLAVSRQASPESAEHVRRAYSRLRALGL